MEIECGEQKRVVVPALYLGVTSKCLLSKLKRDPLQIFALLLQQ
jgi:hypothetical protein